MMAATQRPVAAAAFGDRSGSPAWKSLPSWAVVATGDKAAGADLVRSMARRAGAEITEVESSHVVMVSQPQAVRRDPHREGGRRRAAVVVTTGGAMAQARRSRSSIRSRPVISASGTRMLGPTEWPGGPAPSRVAVRHPQLRGGAAPVGGRGYRVVVPHLRGYGTTRFLSEDDAEERPAGGARRRCGRAARCARDRSRDRWGLRLGRAHGERHGRALARALHGMVSVSGYLIGNQEANRRRCRRAPSSPGGTSSTSRPSEAEIGYERVSERLRQADLADWRRPSGVRRRDVRAKRAIVREPGPRTRS